MSELWEATLDGFIYSQPSGAPDDGGDLIASGLDARTAEQITREHNAHEALVQALTDALYILKDFLTDGSLTDDLAIRKASAALALAERKE